MTAVRLYKLIYWYFLKTKHDSLGGNAEIATWAAREQREKRDPTLWSVFAEVGVKRK